MPPMQLPSPAQAGHDLVAAYYAAFNAGDRRAMLVLLAEDVIHDLNQGPRQVGKSVFAAFMQRMDRCYRERLADIRICVSSDGTHAAAEYVVHGTYLAQDEGLPPATGQTYVLPGGAFFDLRSGRIGRVTNYYNLEDWLAQVHKVGS
jgi:steroid delta-isomerase-like uncharacterized protein